MTRAGGRPALPLRAAVAALLMVAVGALAGCGEDTPEQPDPSPTTPSAAADPPAGPASRACYALPFDSAVAPTTEAEPVPCTGPHTSETVAVGEIDAVVDGHLLAVDSEHVQARVAASCRPALEKYVGGGQRRLRLSMIRPVWFTPTVEESDAGAEWFRCDAVVLSGTETLAELTASVRGVLADGVPDRFAMCGTAAPDSADFERVRCSEEHRWRAIDVITFEATKYPGAKAAKAAGQNRCEDAAAERADDPLSFRWGYEWPTREQWQMGQNFGRCWALD
ncbi:septum formation family protein [Nocardioides caeni]|uniref:Septum formation-related domain-containing protein n=1 Tax=Nocardioides caeni TaxID=574700 RepID=A0A4S8NKM2_9ACTN|nr:septum formation family protein [Nocardioides caeni]THV17623.1 hypothetical protein E9934_03835 [Nocardioides caeni]